jgi:hypothetical protein
LSAPTTALQIAVAAAPSVLPRGGRDCRLLRMAEAGSSEAETPAMAFRCWIGETVCLLVMRPPFHRCGAIAAGS